MAKPAKFTTLQSSDAVLNRVQDNIAKQVNPALKSRLSNGILLIGVVIGVSGVAVNHKLGRKLLGWFVTDQNANAVVWRSDYAAPVNAQAVLNLSASAVVTVNLWVF